MAITWAEVRQEILVLLDEDKDADPSTHDIAWAVQRRMHRSRSKLFNLRKPLGLFVESAAVSIVSTTTYIALQTGAGVNPGLAVDPSTLWKIYSLAVQENTDDESDDYNTVCKLQMKKHGYIDKQKAIDASLIKM